MLKFLTGLFLGTSLAAAGAQVFVSVPTNGTLKGYTVQDARGREVCRDPEVWNDFQGEGSFIVCPE